MLSDTAAAGYNGAGQYQQVANFEHYHSYQQHLQTQQSAQVASAQAYQNSAGSQLAMHHNQHFQLQHVRDVSGRSSSGSLTGEPVGNTLGPAAMIANAGTHPFHPAATVAAIQTHQQHQHTNHQYHQYHHQRHSSQQQQQLVGANTAVHLQAHPHSANLHPQAHQHQHHHQHQHQHQAPVQQPLSGHQHAHQFQFHSHLGHHNRHLHQQHHHHHHHPTMMTAAAANPSTSPYSHAPIGGHNHTPPSQYPHQDQQPQHQQYPAMSHYAQHLNSHPQHNAYGHVHTTPPFGAQSAGSMVPLGSPTDTISEMSPVLMKQESAESRLAILTDHIDQTLKKESQLEQLHQQCASLLDEQQRAPLGSTGGSQHLMSSNLQHPEPKLGTNELNSGSKTPTSANNNNDNNNNTANNSNGNSTTTRSKRLSPYDHTGTGGRNHTSPSQYAQHPEQPLQHRHQQHSAVSHYTQHLNSQAQCNAYAHAQMTPPFGGQPPGSMISLRSPRDVSEMSPGLMKQESTESRLAMQTDPTLKKESQLEQLHQQCASLLDEQQRVPLVSTGGAQHMISGNLQQLDSKLGPTESNSGSQTPTSTNNNNSNSTTTTNNNNNNNINSNANNNNGNSTNGRSKRLRTSFKHHQLKEMKKWFSKNQNPDAKDLKTLAQTTGLSKRVLQVWFQNARAKFRRNNAKAANQQLQYNVNQHTSHMLQFQQAPDHPIHTYGQQHHLNQHTLISHHHHNHQHQQQHQSRLQGAPVSSAGVVAPIAMPAAVHTTPSDSSTHNAIQHQQAPREPAHTQSQAQDGAALMSGSDGCMSSFAQLDID